MIEGMWLATMGNLDDMKMWMSFCKLITKLETIVRRFVIYD